MAAQPYRMPLQFAQPRLLRTEYTYGYTVRLFRLLIPKLWDPSIVRNLRGTTQYPNTRLHPAGDSPLSGATRQSRGAPRNRYGLRTAQPPRLAPAPGAGLDWLLTIADTSQADTGSPCNWMPGSGLSLAVLTAASLAHLMSTQHGIRSSQHPSRRPRLGVNRAVPASFGDKPQAPRYLSREATRGSPTARPTPLPLRR